MFRSLLLYLSERESPRKLLMDNPLGRRLASRFIAGEEIADALRVIRRLNEEGFRVTLDQPDARATRFEVNFESAKKGEMAAGK